MIDFRLTQVSSPTEEQLAGFKAFIAANGAETDAFLSSLLQRAMMAVQAWEDRSLLPATAVLSVTGREDTTAPVALYQSVAAVSSVVDGAGDSLEFSLVGRMVIPSFRTAALTITYTTAPDEGDLAELMPKAYRYGAAMYDGEDAPTLNRILQER